MSLINEAPSNAEWTKLENKKCTNCPLNATDNPYCPIAQNIESVVSNFSTQKSFLKATVTVLTKERNYEKFLS
jgi:hypothetical protein